MQDNTSNDRHLQEFRQQHAADFRAHEPSCCADPANCPSSDSLARLAENRLRWPLRQRLSRHLATCNACADDYHVMCQASRNMQATLRPQQPWWQTAPAAINAMLRPGGGLLRPAMFTAAVALAVSLLWLTPTDTSHRSTANTADPASTVAVAAADDVLFRSDFDTGSSSMHTGLPEKQTIFSDDFGG